jgi:molybdate transport system ATP-binding protein
LKRLEMATPKVLVELTDVSVRVGNSVILSGVNWSLRSGESWAVLGGNGVGKTTFLNLVRGDVWPAPEHGKRLYCANGSAKESPIGFREKTGLVSPELLDRYRREGWNLCGLEVVCTGFQESPFLYDKPTQIQLDRCHEILSLLGMEGLADRRILTMSHGEAKKILIARALVHRPRILFLDEVAAGLDAGSKDTLLGMLEQAAGWGTQMVYAAHDAEQIPSAIKQALALRSGRIVEQGTIAEVSARFNGRGKARVPLMLEPRSVPRRQKSYEEALIQIRGVDVSRGGKRILREIDWTMRPRENWAIVGKNGSGKTTLLKLIVGDLRPVWGGTIRRFAPESPRNLWEIRRRISFVTPDLQHSHVCRQTSLEMVLSGFYGSVGLPQEATREQIAAARSWFRLLWVEELENREVATLSHGQIRMLLILRAVVTGPRILALDEPMSGLDKETRGSLLPVFENLTAMGTSLIYVTHKKHELLPSITHVAVLEKGEMVFQGLRQQWEDLQYRHC